jgi:hypothetical protein
MRPDWPITVLVIPGTEALAPRSDEQFEALHLDYLDDAALVRALHGTTYARQDRLAGPALVERLLLGGAESVLYLAAESLMVSDPRELEQALAAHDAVVVPRVRGLLPDDGERPDASDLQNFGDLDDGIFAVRNTDAGRRVAEWRADQARASTVALTAVASSSGSSAFRRSGRIGPGGWLRSPRAPPCSAIRCWSRCAPTTPPTFAARAGAVRRRRRLTPACRSGGCSGTACATTGGCGACTRRRSC